MLTSYTGLIILGAAVIICAACSLFSGKARLHFTPGRAEKKQWLKERIADSLEECAPIHLNVGTASDSDLSNAAVLTAAEAGKTVSAQMAFADEPWLISSSSAAAGYFEKDAVKTGLDNADYGSDFDEDCTVYTGFSPVFHQAASDASLSNTPAALHLNIGSFGSTAALQDMGYDCSEGILTAGDDLSVQAVGLLTADRVFVGEESFELPLALKNEERTSPELLAMDVFRFAAAAVAAVVIILGVIGMVL